MASIFGLHIPGTKRISPSDEAGVSGTAVFGGYVDNREKNPVLSDSQRYETALDILSNISVVAASLRYFLNLLAKPAWSVKAVDESAEAIAAAEFLQEIIDNTETSWTTIIRRAAMYKFYGFSINEWTMQKRSDGKIGLKNIESRAQHTIERWEITDDGTILGVFQRSPQNGNEYPIDRWKFIYLVDNLFSDSPEGLGWFRNLAEPATRLKEYLKLEKIGFERDLSGVPVGRAPITAINRAVKAGTLSRADGDRLIDGLKNFVKMEIKKESTGIILDSQTFEATTSDGTQPTGTAQWGVELLTGDPGSLAELGKSIERLNVEMARIIGTETIFVGTGGPGSLALSRDKSSNLYLQIDSTLSEIVEQFSKDLISPIWALNGLPDNLKPTFVTEDVSFKDVEQVTAALRDLAAAGGVLAPDDPAINDLRDLLGLSHQKEPAL